MDINTDLTYVTCLYDDLFGTEFGGRPDPIWRRYYYSLETLTNMMAPIVIFTWPHQVEKIKNYYETFLGKGRFDLQIKVLPFDLYLSPLYDIIKRIKTRAQGYENDRSYDVSNAKFLFLRTVSEENYFNSKYVFWIDAGLSHSALFPNKYLDISDPYKQYTTCKLFTPTVVTESIRKTNDKLLFIRCDSIGHWIPPELVNSTELNDANIWYIVGGYFGGRIDHLKQFCSNILEELVGYINTHNFLCLEEQVLTIHTSFNKELYTYEKFDRWYHENSGDWAQPYLVNKRSFYRIFEELNNL